MGLLNLEKKTTGIKRFFFVGTGIDKHTKGSKVTDSFWHELHNN